MCYSFPKQTLCCINIIAGHNLYHSWKQSITSHSTWGLKLNTSALSLNAYDVHISDQHALNSRSHISQRFNSQSHSIIKCWYSVRYPLSHLTMHTNSIYLKILKIYISVSNSTINDTPQHICLDLTTDWFYTFYATHVTKLRCVWYVRRKID